jgi:hypothetical protein
VKISLIFLCIVAFLYLILKGNRPELTFKRNSMIRNHLSKLLFFTPLILFAGTLHAQGVYVYPGANVMVTGTPTIIINDGEFSQEGIFNPALSTVKITGSQALTSISGSGGITFNHLTIDKSAGDVELNGNILVPGNLNMVNGIIELNGSDILLGTTGNIVGENNATYITGTSGGTIVRTATLNAPAAANPGNIGIAITTPVNLGNTTITRGHEQQTGLTTGIGIARYFDIVPAPGSNVGLGATLDFHYLDHELMGLTEANLEMAQKTAPMGWWFMIGDDGLDLPNNTLTKNNIDTFGRFTLTDELNDPLPIKLVTFAGRLLNRQTLLNWDVSYEQGVTNYDVERSADGKSFSKLGSVTAKGNNGVAQLKYDYTDPAPFNGSTFYRLKINEQNGTFNYSKVIRVELSEVATLNVYPNPASDKVTIDFSSIESKKMSFRLLDVQGKVIEVKEVSAMPGMNKVEWNVSALAAATYYLQLDGINNTPIKFSKL